MNNKRKWLAVFLIIALSMSLLMPGLAMADDDDEDEVRVNLRDVGKHWARNNVECLNAQGIINGYPDGTFRPEAPVTTAEAVVMAVRLLGLDEQARAKANDRLAFTDAAAIPEWARGYVAVAVEKGLVNGTGQFQPMKKATRMDVTVLLVKTLSAEIAIKNNNATVRFTDVNNVSQNNQQYIALAVLNDLIKGYDDKSFQPNKPVTRAEMATLFARLQDQVGSNPAEGRITGKLLVVNASAAKLTVATAAYIPNVAYAVYNDGNTSLRVYELAVAANAPVYRDNKPAALADLKAGDSVTALLNKDNAIVYVNAGSLVIDSSIIEGQVKKVDAVNRTIRLYQRGIVDVDYTVAQSAYISRDGAGVTLDKIVTGDWVKMERDSSGTVVRIEAKSYDTGVADFDEIKIEIEGKDFKIKMEQNAKGKAKVEVKFEDEDEDEDEDEIEDDAISVIALDNDDDEDEEEEEEERNKEHNKKDKHNKERNKEHNKNQNKNQNNNQNQQNNRDNKQTTKVKTDIKLTGAEAAAFIRQFVAEAKIGDTIDADLIIAAVEKMLGITVDKNKVEIEIEIRDGNKEMEFEF